MSGADRLKYATFALAGFIPVVGWAGRAAKGGKAIHSTAKGMKTVDNPLSAYQHGKSLDILRKTEYGIYGLASAKGFGEYITGKDMFGNELSEEKRNQSLTESLFILGVSGMGMYVDRLQAGNSIYGKVDSKAKGNNQINSSFADAMDATDAKRYNQFWDYVQHDIKVDDRIKIGNWDYSPSGELYSKYKPTFDNPKYYNQENGNINWPNHNGFDGKVIKEELPAGHILDRYGEAGGSFLSPDGVPFEKRALALHSENANYYRYEVINPFEVESGKIAPWFDRPGGGTQYYLGNVEIFDPETGKYIIPTVEDLERLGHIIELR